MKMKSSQTGYPVNENEKFQTDYPVKDTLNPQNLQGGSTAHIPAGLPCDLNRPVRQAGARPSASEETRGGLCPMLAACKPGLQAARRGPQGGTSHQSPPEPPPVLLQALNGAGLYVTLPNHSTVMGCFTLQAAYPLTTLPPTARSMSRCDLLEVSLLDPLHFQWTYILTRLDVRASFALVRTHSRNEIC